LVSTTPARRLHADSVRTGVDGTAAGAGVIAPCVGWMPALLAGSIIGGYLGSHLAIRKGNLGSSDRLKS